jgi:hypothetical protein
MIPCLGLIVLLVAGVDPPSRVVAQVPVVGAGYEGPLEAASLTVTVDIADSYALVSLDYQLVNPSETRVTATASFDSGKRVLDSGYKALSLEPHSTEILVHQVKYPVLGDSLRAVRIEPRLVLDGKPMLARFRDVTVLVKLPPGVPRLMATPLPGGRRSMDTDDPRRVVLEYRSANQYLAPLLLRWRGDGRGVVVTKTARATEEKVEFVVHLSNPGAVALENLTVSDNFHPALVTSGTPAEEFAVESGMQNDERLVWRRQVPKLAAGESVDLAYAVALATPVPQGWKFGQTTVVSADGDLLGYSEKVPPAGP